MLKAALRVRPDLAAHLGPMGQATQPGGTKKSAPRRENHSFTMNQKKFQQS